MKVAFVNSKAPAYVRTRAICRLFIRSVCDRVGRPIRDGLARPSSVDTFQCDQAPFGREVPFEQAGLLAVPAPDDGALIGSIGII